MGRVIMSVSDVSLAQGVTLTLVQAVMGARGGRIAEWGVSFNGSALDEAAILCQLCVQSTAGTSSALTPALTHTAGTVVLTARKTFTAEPAASTPMLRERYVAPYAGFEMPFPEMPGAGVGSEYGYRFWAEGVRIGIRVIAPAAMTTVKAAAYLEVEE